MTRSAGLPLTVLPERLAVCRLEPDAALPAWATASPLFSAVVRTRDELSVLTTEDMVPADARAERGYRAFMVRGPLPFHLVGVFAALASPLADAGIPIFALSTFDTDYVLVREQNLERALHILHADPGRRLITSGSPYEPVIGFSRAVRAGSRVLVSGTGPVMPDGGCPESTADQARRCWEIVLAALAEAGASATDVVRTRTLLTPAADAEGAMTAHGEVFADVRPASTMVVIHALLDDRWTVEVEAEAQLDP